MSAKANANGIAIEIVVSHPSHLLRGEEVLRMAHTNEFIFERLDVYRVAKEALSLVIRYRERLKGLPGGVAGQLERAAVSTIANIAEATGRVGRADRRNRFAIARAEANEAGAMIEIARLYGVFRDSDYAMLRSSYQRVTYMLTAMMRQ